MFQTVSSRGSEPGVRRTSAGATAHCERSGGPSPGLTIVFHGAKGGVGTTTLVGESTVVLSRRMRTLAIDADLERGALHYRLDVPVRSDTLCTGDVADAWEDLPPELLRNTVSKCPCGAGLLPSRTGDPGRRLPHAQAATFLLDSATRLYDRVLIDTGVGGGPFTRELLSRADVAVLVLTPELASLGSARRILDESPRRRGFIVAVNRALGRRDLFSRRDVESFLGVRVAAWLPEDTARCRSLSGSCRPITSERSQLSSDIRSLVYRLG